MKNKIQIVEPDPYQQGYVAGFDPNVSGMDNPYNMNTDTDRHFDWEDGLIQGRKDDIERKNAKITWALRRQAFKEGVINILYSMVFVAVCYIIGTSVRYLLR